MREIKFRAWARRGEWDADGEKQKFVMIDADSLAFEEYLPISELLCDHDDDFYLMQYTGLKDKNGKEIYEGDIVKLWSKSVGDRWYCSLTTSVVWSDSGLNWNVYPHHDKDHTWEVIGNIWQNPELIK